MNTTFQTPSGHRLNLTSRWRAATMREGSAVVLLTFVDEHGNALGFVSVDEAHRGFDIGQTEHVRANPQYKGRGWQDRLFADAMAHVEAIWA